MEKSEWRRGKKKEKIDTDFKMKTSTDGAYPSLEKFFHWWSFFSWKKENRKELLWLGWKNWFGLQTMGLHPQAGDLFLEKRLLLSYGVWFLLWGGKQRIWSLTFCFLFHFQSCSTSSVIKPVTFFCYEVLPWQICSRTRPLISLKAEKLTANTCSSTGSEAISLSSSLS